MGAGSAVVLGGPGVAGAGNRAAGGMGGELVAEPTSKRIAQISPKLMVLFVT